MKTRKYKHGLSLVEMLIVIGVIAMLATMVIGVASRIDTQAKERGVESLFTLLEGALEEYHDFKGVFPAAMNADPNLNSEILYEQLSSVPACREILGKISNSLIKQNVDTGKIPPVPEIYDPWGTVLNYLYNPATDNFPELISAGPDKKFRSPGPDGQFGSPDDVISSDDISNKSK